MHARVFKLHVGMSIRFHVPVCVFARFYTLQKSECIYLQIDAYVANYERFVKLIDCSDVSY